MKTRTWKRTRFAGQIAGLILCQACSSSAPKEERPPLPLHIAIAPLTADDVRTDRKAGSEGDATKMKVKPDAPWMATFTKGLAQALEERAFVSVTLLQPPKAEAQGEAQAQGLDAAVARDSALISEARAKGADLLLRLELSLQPVIREEKNSTFWINLPLFALGGPFGWWLSDRTYFLDAEVTGWFYDPRTLAATPLDDALRATRLEIASATRRTESVDLDFNTRAQGDVGDYMLSIICPAGFLAGQSDELKDELANQIVEQLGRGLARSVLDQSAILERGAVGFYVDVANSGLTRDDAGGYVLKGSALLSPTRDIDSLRAWKVQVASNPPLVHEFDNASPPVEDGAFRRYRFEERLGKVAPGTQVRLEIEAGERSPRVRSYTFRVPGETSLPSPE